jgi:hypothetical protein
VLLRGWKRIPWKVRVPGRLVRAGTTPPLDGDGMSRWLYEAADGMDAEPQRPSGLTTLMPDGHDLELFVTATDFAGYDRELVISNPPLVHDQAHRHVLTFRHGDRDDDFGPQDNGWLAFSARATSSFPGAFPPGQPAGVRIHRPARGRPAAAGSLLSASTSSPAPSPPSGSSWTAASWTTGRSGTSSTRFAPARRACRSTAG